jgi:hypothetical protein
VPRFDWSRIEAEARRLLADWRGLLARNATEGRQVLRQLLEEPIRFTPFEEDGRRGYRFTGKASVGSLLGGLVEVTM